jgi:Flp pilus assembly protein TadG
MIRRSFNLARDERGASIIEMALILPVFSTLVIGVADISRAYSQKLLLEQAAYRAIEKVQSYQATESTFDTLKNEVVSASTDAGFTDVTAADVTVDFWLECDGTRQASYDSTCATESGTARWISVDVKHKFTPMFASSRWPGSNVDGTYTLHGRAGLRTQ